MRKQDGFKAPGGSSSASGNTPLGHDQPGSAVAAGPGSLGVCRVLLSVWGDLSCGATEPPPALQLSGGEDQSRSICISGSEEKSRGFSSPSSAYTVSWQHMK